MFNVLYTCSSRKIHTIKWLEKTLLKKKSKIKIFLSDSNPNVISKYFGDFFWKSPEFKKKNFNKILNFLLKNQIKIIFPSSDKELNFWAEYRDILKKKKIFVMVSDKKTIKICLDKYLFYNFLKSKKILSVPAYLKINSFKSKRYVVKSRYGQGEKNCFLNLNYKDCKKLSKNINHSIYQPYLKGKEISIDCYIYNSKKVEILMRYRKLIHRGESEHVVFFKSEIIRKIISNLISQLNFSGHVMFQGIIYNKKFYILECNPRIGGASVVCYHKNFNSFKKFIEDNVKIKIKDFVPKNKNKFNSFILHKTVTAID